MGAVDRAQIAICAARAEKRIVVDLVAAEREQPARKMSVRLHRTAVDLFELSQEFHALAEEAADEERLEAAAERRRA